MGNKKQLVLFVSGVLLVGGLVFLIKNPSSNNLPLPQAPIEKSPEESNLNRKEDGGKMTKEEKTAVPSPKFSIDASKNYVATLKTSLGDIVIQLDAKNRPQTVNNFVYLAKLGFYNETIFHRVIDNFMIQGGDPLGSGMGGPAYKFNDELSSPNSNSKGTISMANAGPNTNGSQFFINLVDNNYLDTKHSVFGKVTSGMDVVEKIGKTPVGRNDAPITAVVISSVSISE